MSSSDAYKRFRETSYFPNFDGLRFICIAMVLWHHAQPIPWGTYQLADRGFLGVDFFFVLSGFLITTLLLREADRDGQFHIRHFYIRRIIRIVPIYFFVVTAMALYSGFVKGMDIWHLLPFYYLFLSNFLTDHIPTLSITWSLSVEEQFYMLWPAALLFLPRKWLPWGLSLVIAINFAVGAGLLNVVAPELGPLRIALPTATYAPILLGALAAMILHSKRGFEVLYAALGAKAAPLVALIGLVVVLAITPEDVHGWPNLAIHLTMTAMLLTLVLTTDGVVSKALQLAPLRRMGVVSYGIYLYHLIGLDLTIRVLGRVGLDNAWITLVTYTLLSFAMAEISFRTLEAYFRRFRPKT